MCNEFLCTRDTIWKNRKAHCTLLNSSNWATGGPPLLVRGIDWSTERLYLPFFLIDVYVIAQQKEFSHSSCLPPTKFSTTIMKIISLYVCVCWCVKPTHTERVSKYWHIRHHQRHKEYRSQWMLGCHNTVKQIIELDGIQIFPSVSSFSTTPRTNNIMMSCYVMLRNGMHTPHPQDDYRLTPMLICKGAANALLDPLS